MKKNFPFVLPAILVILSCGLSSCGIKPGNLEPPSATQGQDAKEGKIFPNNYPQKSTTKQ